VENSYTEFNLHWSRKNEKLSGIHSRPLKAFSTTFVRVNVFHTEFRQRFYLCYYITEGKEI